MSQERRSSLISKVIALVTLPAFAVTGCASIFNGTTDSVRINSDVPGTEIFVDGRKVGNDRAFATVPKKGDHFIRVAKEGCEDTEVQIPYSFDAATLLGILIDWGLVSILVVDLGINGSTSKASQTQFVLSPDCSKIARRRVKQRALASEKNE
jgi:hypothetical protein